MTGLYILLDEKGTAQELIPDIDPVFPGVPIEERYAPDFVSRLIHVPDDTEVQQRWVYDRESGLFNQPIPEVPAVKLGE